MASCGARFSPANPGPAGPRQADLARCFEVLTSLLAERSDGA
jgi:hypothetical protein